MPVDIISIRKIPARHFFKITAPIQKKQRSVLFQINVTGIIVLLNFKPKNIPIKTNHRFHVFYKNTESI